ncbi:MAG TPA: DNA polymerase Y family protein [Terriglobales bacterium]|nr:DNA polymerase Y family protein [Terriglobales bacterium]
MYACLHLPDFPVAAVVRVEPELRRQPVAVVDGIPPLERVLAANDVARAAGVELGMALLPAEALPGLKVRRRSLAQEAAAHAALLDAAAAFSPRVEDAAADTVLLDLSGLAHLFGAPENIARGLAARCATLGLEARVAVASNPNAACHAARGFSGVTVIPRGQEAARLGPLPVDILEPAPELLETLDRWGVRTLRALAALPAVAVAERLGQAGVELQKLARGESAHTLRPIEPPLHFEETLELEHPVELLEPLAFILARLLDALCARLAARALAAQELRLTLGLEESVSSFTFQVSRDPSQPETRSVKRETVHQRQLRFPQPMLDSKIFLKLLHLDLQSHPPPAPVVKVTLAAEPAPPRAAQGGLFLPLAPEPEKLELTLARLGRVVGEKRLGAVEILDTHRPDAHRMQRFRLPPQGLKPGDRRSREQPARPFDPRFALAQEGKQQGARMALRRFRPPLPARVQVRNGRPVSIFFCGARTSVLALAGPWRNSGEWWTEQGWTREEWDVSLLGGEGSASYRICRDGNGWFVEGIYD